MDAAAVDPVKVVVVPVHEMHGTDEECVPVEFPECFEVLANKGLPDDLPELGRGALLALPDRVMHIFYPFQERLVLVDGPALF